jgi:hypothetical protein
MRLGFGLKFPLPCGWLTLASPPYTFASLKELVGAEAWLRLYLTLGLSAVHAVNGTLI